MNREIDINIATNGRLESVHFCDPLSQPVRRVTPGQYRKTSGGEGIKRCCLVKPQAHLQQRSKAAQQRLQRLNAEIAGQFIGTGNINTVKDDQRIITARVLLQVRHLFN